MVSRVTIGFEKIAQKVAQTVSKPKNAKKSKAKFESKKHLHQTIFEKNKIPLTNLALKMII